MTLTVTPITAQERVHCAYCAKPLQPNNHCRKTFYSHSQEAAGRTPEEQLVAYATNRRVVRIARSYWNKHDDKGDVIGREVSRIEIVFFPEPDEWGLWGKFCTNICAMRFGYAAHQAGYRIKR